MRWLRENVRRLAILMVLLGSLGMLASMDDNPDLG